MDKFSRRIFLLSSSSAVLLGSAKAIGMSDFNHHGMIKSSQNDLRFSSETSKPLTKNLTIYALIEPDFSSEHVEVHWQFSTDEQFNNIVQEDSVSFITEQQNLLSITLMQVPSGAILYYRFNCKHCSLIEQSESLNELLSKDEIETRYISVYPTKAISKNLLSLMRKEIKAYDMTTNFQSS